MKKTTLEWILKIGVVASWLSFFIVSKSLYFPYVTGKQLYFNILVEILFGVWLYLIFKYPKTQPKRSLITISFFIWLAVMLVSSIFGVDFNLSFWGDAERMLGWFSLAHYFILYLIIITVFRTKDDWSWLLNSSIVVAVILAVYSFLTNTGWKNQGNVNLASNISTLGNATYVAGVMLFNIYFSLYFFLTRRDWRIKFLYLVALIIILAEFFYADVSGSQAGLAVSLVLFGGCYGWLHKNKKIKWGSLLGVAGLVVILATMFIFRNAPIFNNKFGSILRGFSTNNTSLNARLYSWQAGWKGFKARPLLGYGWGNYSAPFDEFFKAGLYDWTPNEEFYDRAHNMVIEMLADAGVPGLLAYLFIFVAIFIILIKAQKQGRLKPIAFASVVAIFSAYFIHNLAVFDALPNFVCLSVALGWVFWLTSESTPEQEVNYKKEKNSLSSLRLIILMVMWILLAVIINYGNIRVIKMFSSAMRGTTYWYQGQTSEFKTYYKKTFSYNTPLDRDVRNLYIGFFLANPYALVNLPEEELKGIFDLAQELDAKNLALSPLDHFAWMRHAQLLNLIGRITNNQDMIKESLVAAEKATERGGGHLIPYLLRANTYEALKDPQKAVDTIKEALKIYPDYRQALCPLVVLENKYKIKVEPKELWSQLDHCVDKGDLNALVQVKYMEEAIKHYESVKDQARLNILKSFVPTTPEK
jgi:O-antigen ligase